MVTLLSAPCAECLRGIQFNMKDQYYRRPVAVDSFICDRLFSFSAKAR